MDKFNQTEKDFCDAGSYIIGYTSWEKNRLKVEQYKPWIHGLDKVVCETVISNPELVDYLFTWSYSPQNHSFWGAYCFDGLNRSKAESILRSWVRKEKPLKPLLWE